MNWYKQLDRIEILDTLKSGEEINVIVHTAVGDFCAVWSREEVVEYLEDMGAFLVPKSAGRFGGKIASPCENTFSGLPATFYFDVK